MTRPSSSTAAGPAAASCWRAMIWRRLGARCGPADLAGAARRGCGATPSCCRWPTRRDRVTLGEGGTPAAARCRGWARSLDVDAVAQGRGAEPDRHVQGAGRGGGRGARERTGRADAGPAHGGNAGTAWSAVWRGGGPAGRGGHAPGRAARSTSRPCALYGGAAAPGGRADQRRGRVGGRGGRDARAGTTRAPSRSPTAWKARRRSAWRSPSSWAGRAPDVILYPTGGGVGLIGLWKAFRELRDAGLAADRWRPAPAGGRAGGGLRAGRARLGGGGQTTAFWEGAATVAAGLRVPGPLAGGLMLRVLRETRRHRAGRRRRRDAPGAGRTGAARGCGSARKARPCSRPCAACAPPAGSAPASASSCSTPAPAWSTPKCRRCMRFEV